MAYFYLLKQYLKYAGAYRKWAIVNIVLFILAYSSYVFEPYIFAQILNALQVMDHNTVLITVTRWTVIWLSLFVTFNFCFRVGNYMENIVAYEARRRFIIAHYNILTRLPMSWHADNHSGASINRINTAARALQDFGRMQHELIDFFVSFIGPIIALSLLSTKIAIMAAAMVLVALAVITFFDKKLVSYFDLINELNHKASATFFDFVSNIRTIIILKLGKKTEKDLDEKIEAGVVPNKRMSFVNQIKWLFVNFSTTLLQVLVVFYYIYLQITSKQKVKVGNAAAVFQYLSHLSSVFWRAAITYQRIVQFRTNLKAVDKITEVETVDAKSVSHLPKNWREISIRGLSFVYEKDKDAKKKNTLQNVSFEIKRGAKIAVIGESGSGKTTLMSLLRGLYLVPEVSVLVDGKNQKSKLALFTNITTLMPQDPEIFENTIRYNITLDLDYNKKEVSRVIKLASFDRVLKNLPKGLDSDIREKGVNLSGGERQRLALARNLLAASDSEIILMDEPTSSVDMENEELIYKNIFKYYKDKTIISSVHKLYLLPMFDYVIKMSNGKIIRCGKPDEFVKKK